MIEYSDIVEDLATMDGLSGRFIMSVDDGTTFEVPFYFDGASRTLAVHGIDGNELVEFRTEWEREARDAWMAHRDAIRDLDVATPAIPFTTILPDRTLN
jgi:hypothetical protein